MNAPETMSHEQAAELLPWLVNDSLDEREARAAREHARSCVICRRELATLEQLRASIVQSSASEPMPPPDMRSINRRIDALVAKRNRAREWASQIRAALTRPWPVAFVAQSILLLVVTAVLVWPDPVEREFATLTQPQGLPDGDYVRVVFSPDLPEVELAALLGRFRLTVAHGPTDRGVYTLQIGAGTAPADRDTLVADLKGHPRVLFAQPVTGGTGR